MKSFAYIVILASAVFLVAACMPTTIEVSATAEMETAIAVDRVFETALAGTQNAPTATPTGTPTAIPPTPAIRPKPVLIIEENIPQDFNGFTLVGQSSFSDYQVGVLAATAVGASEGVVFFSPPWVITEVAIDIWVMYNPNTRQIEVWDKNPDEP